MHAFIEVDASWAWERDDAGLPPEVPEILAVLRNGVHDEPHSHACKWRKVEVVCLRRRSRRRTRRCSCSW